MPPLIAAAGAAIAGAIGLTGIAATIVGGIISVGLSIGVSKLVGPRGSSGQSQQEDTVTGSRVQLPPATNNKLPVVYGTAFVGGSIVDAKISTDLQTMWYVIAVAEVTNTMPGDTADTITFDQLYYDGKLVTLSGSSVTALTTNTAGGGETDTKINGYLDMYLFPNGSSSGTNTGGQSAITIMSDAGIPADQRWNQGIYTANGQSADMTNTAFVIVKVKYNQDAGTTQLGAVTAKITNSRTKPGDCIKDYLYNDRYGCGVPLANIDNASMTALNTYSDKPIVYTPMGGGPTTTQVRYRFNGPVDTTKNCLSNLQDMVDACDSWMQYSELTGKWKVVINKAYDETPDAQTLNDLFSVTDDNLVSGLQVNPTDLNQTYNQVEYQYPNTNIKDQLDYIFIALQDTYPSLLSENEPLNKLIIKNDLVNNNVQGKFIAIRRLLQAREDLIVNLQTDYSGIQVEAGDIIKITNSMYGWTDKLFRVNNVIEEKDPSGNLFARMTAFEYNATIYDDDLDITDYIPADNTGLQDPNIIGTPAAPIATFDGANTLNTINVTGTVPNVGLVRYLDFNYGTTTNTANHLYYSTSTNSNGAPLVGNATYTINVNDIADAGNLYWSVTAKNDSVGVRSAASNVVVWPGANVSTWDGNTGGITGNNIQDGTVTGNNIANNTVTSNNMSNTGVTIGSYTNADITVDGAGRITSAANGTPGISGIIVQDQGVTISNTTTSMNFTGSGVTANATGNFVTVDIPGSSFPAGTMVELITGPESDGSSSIQNAARTLTNSLKDFEQGVGSGQGIGYLTPNSISSSYTFPFLQGTSDTANLYQANSTAGLGTPSGSPFYTASAPTPDGAGWIGPLYASYSSGTPNLGGWALVKEVKHNSFYTEDKDFYYMTFCNFQVTCDSDTILYYAGSWSQTSGAINNHYIGSEKIGSIDIKAWRPYYISYNFSYRGMIPNSAQAVQATALWMRNAGSTGNIYVTHTDMLIKSTDGVNYYINEGYPWSPDA